jgi:hypothetical protein
MANHGYINRDGKNLKPWDVARGLRACYGLTYPFSVFLTYTTYLVLRKFRPIELYEIGKHGVIEHNASLVHHDTPAGQEFAPIAIDQQLVEAVVQDAQTVVQVESEVDGVKTTRTETLLSPADVGRARVRRERESPIGALPAEIARGEMAIILGVWEKRVGDKAGAPVEWIRRWLGEERLPDGWRPTQTFGLAGTRERNKMIKASAEAIRKAEAEGVAPTASPSGADS